MTEGSAAGRGEGRLREEGGGRAGGRGGGRRGEGAGAAAAAAGFPASSPRCAPRSLGRCSPRRPAAPRLGLPLWPRLLPPSGAGALRFPLFLLRLRLLPHKYQLLTPSPDLAAAAAATLRSALASRDFRAASARPAASSLLACLPARSSSWANRAARAPRRPRPLSPSSSRIGGRRDGSPSPPPTRARWLAAARDVSAPPPPPPSLLVARLPPSAVQQQRSPPPRGAPGRPLEQGVDTAAAAAAASGAGPVPPSH
ncbi:WAS/WASL-interacting protein family member 2-like [Muntiacus reevesi]|uniref:WAS/WASL-interacting protein family member 2-like n=1 Tax=Muntiacus reevesi TaxID=9886 RepID=UPI0033073978